MFIKSEDEMEKKGKGKTHYKSSNSYEIKIILELKLRTSQN